MLKVVLARWGAVAIALMTLLCARVRAEETGAGNAFFESKIRPVLAEHCSKCHSAHADKLKAGFSVDSRAALIRGGESGAALSPGHPEASLLIKAVGYGDAELQMPPKTKLSDQAVVDLTRWVKMGAPWPADAEQPTATTETKPAKSGAAHWAFQAVHQPALPAVRDSGWGRNEIDRFILAGLEAKNLKPAPAADRRTLARRISFDLVGLPPDPAEVDAFEIDASPQAYEKMVDRLLASPRYGERWGRYWLDLACYADTNGADENYTHPNAWRYRDYVVRAFNNDLPYDRFITEQLAGDLLPNAGAAAPPDAASNEQAVQDRLIATGFLLMGPKMLAEQDKTKLVMDLVDGQIDVTSQTFLGLTVGCARCHDHKFDPISAADYYALAGIFKSTKSMANLGFVSEWNERELPDRARQSEVERSAAEISAAKAGLTAFGKETGSEADRKRLTELKDKLAALERARPTLASAMAVAED